MAALTVGKLMPMLSALRLPQVEQVRFHRVALRPRRKKPIQKWFDPADKSWAEPILKYQKEKESRPEPEPTMLHMVYRIREHFTRPYWEKDVLKEFGLFEKTFTPVVLKNTPEINEKLRLVQHLLRIKPVTFPYGLPKDEEDYKHCYLAHNGEFVVKQRIDDESDEIAQAWAEVKLVEDDPSEDIWKMDKDTVQKETRRVLDTYRLSEEYFHVKHVYKFNQDGKEFRYKGEHGVASTRQDWH